MILITGGLGFIGAHTARALLDLGHSCVLTQRRATPIPDFLADEVGARISIEQVDCTDQARLLEVGARHDITGIVHLAAASSVADRIGSVDAHMRGLLNALRAAREWRVDRIGIASSIGVYLGVDDTPFVEDLRLAPGPTEPIPVLKRIAELVALLIADDAGFEIVNLRISTIWGPLRDPNEPPFSAIPHLVHAAAGDDTPESSAAGRVPYADDGRDVCYVKDCARGIALLQLAETLNHRTYNVGDGRATTNREIAAAITGALPGARIELLAGRDPDGPDHNTHLDIARIREDTGYQPHYGVERGVADYVAWLRAGHPR